MTLARSNWKSSTTRIEGRLGRESVAAFIISALWYLERQKKISARLLPRRTWPMRL
jgi:hypothetical protein